MVEAVFGADEPSAAAPAVVDLQQELSDVIDEDDGLLIANDGIVGSRVGRQVFFCDAIPEIKGDIGIDSELENERRWLDCVKCGDRRIVPREQFFIFKRAKFRFCASSHTRIAV